MSISVAVLDHGMGNLRSVAKALEAAGARVSVTDEPDVIDGADALCVPGQGIFGRCMSNVPAALLEGWIAAQRPYLGICLGMQILFERSEEGGEGLGILEGAVTKLPTGVTVPHIGWNTVGDRYFYFDHSYAAHATEDVVVGWCEHGERFAAWVRQGSVTGVQFHPEKSGRAGIDVLKGWLAGL